MAHADKVVTGKKSRDGQDIEKPQCVIDYNFAKNELMSQTKCHHICNSALRKTRKWYRKVAIELTTGTSVVNAWVMYNKFIATKKVSLCTFQESLINSLVIEVHDQNPQTVQKQKNTSTNHTLLEAEGSKRTSRKRCKGCYVTISANKGAKKARTSSKRIATYCNLCEGKPYFCLSCFNLRHDVYIKHMIVFCNIYTCVFFHLLKINLRKILFA